MLGLALLLVAADGSGDFKTVQAAVDAGPASGVVIRIRPGTYHEKLVVNKVHVQLRGIGPDASKVVPSYDDSSGTAGSTTKSASVTVSGDDFYAENPTIENTFSRIRSLVKEDSQAALHGPRNVNRSETDGGASAIRVTNLSIDGADTAFESKSIRVAAGWCEMWFTKMFVLRTQRIRY